MNLPGIYLKNTKYGPIPTNTIFLDLSGDDLVKHPNAKTMKDIHDIDVKELPVIVFIDEEVTSKNATILMLGNPMDLIIYSNNMKVLYKSGLFYTLQDIAKFEDLLKDDIVPYKVLLEGTVEFDVYCLELDELTMESKHFLHKIQTDTPIPHVILKPPLRKHRKDVSFDTISFSLRDRKFYTHAIDSQFNDRYRTPYDWYYYTKQVEYTMGDWGEFYEPYAYYPIKWLSAVYNTVEEDDMTYLKYLYVSDCKIYYIGEQAKPVADKVHALKL